MSDRFNPRVAIVTGGGTGLGSAISKELAAAGTHVIVADIDLEKASATAREIGQAAEAAQVDVSDAGQIELLVQKTQANHGSLDLMVNNAGVVCGGEILDLPLDEWQRVLQVNLWGVIAGSVAAYAVMAKQGSGYIVNIASISASLHNPLMGPYVTSKCGVVGFSRVLSMEAEAHGVHVSVVCPGNIRTAMINENDLAWFTPALPVHDVARRILKAVAQRDRIIVFPFYAKVIGWLDRLSPKLLDGLRRAILRDARQAKNQQQSTHRT